MRYTCKQNDILDAICFQVYGSENRVTDVLQANQGLSEQGTHLPQGLVIELPEIQAKAEQTIVQQIKLWD